MYLNDYLFERERDVLCIDLLLAQARPEPGARPQCWFHLWMEGTPLVEPLFAVSHEAIMRWEFSWDLSPSTLTWGIGITGALTKNKTLVTCPAPSIHL